MVREIVHVQIGQCGNQIGNAFWDTIRKEHRLSGDGKWEGNMEHPNDYYLKTRAHKIDVYFQP